MIGDVLFYTKTKINRSFYNLSYNYITTNRIWACLFSNICKMNIDILSRLNMGILLI